MKSLDVRVGTSNPRLNDRKNQGTCSARIKVESVDSETTKVRWTDLV